MVIVLAQSNMFRIPFRPLPSLFGGGPSRLGARFRDGRGRQKKGRGWRGCSLDILLIKLIKSKKFLE